MRSIDIDFLLCYYYKGSNEDLDKAAHVVYVIGRISRIDWIGCIWGTILPILFIVPILFMLPTLPILFILPILFMLPTQPILFILHRS